MAGSVSYASVTVSRWKRFGHDRAYVNIDGVPAGYLDVKTGDVVCDDPSLVGAIRSATVDLAQIRKPVGQQIDVETGDQPGGYVARHSRPSDDAPSTPTGRGQTSGQDRDLAKNQPGREIIAQVQRRADATPLRHVSSRVSGAEVDDRSWNVGVVGEEEIGDALATLGQGWYVLHSVPVGCRGSDIDHVVIGPAGVFTVNSKNHPGAKVWVRGDTVRVNGRNHPYVRNSRFEAERASRLLSDRALFDVDVYGLVAIVGAERGFVVREQPVDGRVALVEQKLLVLLLKSMPTVLGRPSVERIFNVARHLATWQPTTVAWSDEI